MQRERISLNWRPAQSIMSSNPARDIQQDPVWKKNNKKEFDNSVRKHYSLACLQTIYLCVLISRTREIWWDIMYHIFSSLTGCPGRKRLNTKVIWSCLMLWSLKFLMGLVLKGFFSPFRFWLNFNLTLFLVSADVMPLRVSITHGHRLLWYWQCCTLWTKHCIGKCQIYIKKMANQSMCCL